MLSILLFSLSIFLFIILAVFFLIRSRKRKSIERYDSSVERNSELRRKEIIRPENVFESIANIKEVNPYNIKMVEYAKQLVKTIKENDYQKIY